MKYFEKEINGIKVVVSECYQFPMGDCYKGVVYEDGKEIGHIHNNSFDNCTAWVCEFLQRKIDESKKYENMLSELRVVW